MVRCLALLAFLVGAAPAAAEVVFPFGGPVGIEPPPGNVEVADFAGVGDPRTRETIVLDAVTPDIAEAASHVFDEDELARRGVVVERRRAFRAAGREGTLVEGYEDGRGGRKTVWMLLVPMAPGTPNPLGAFVSATRDAHPLSAEQRAVLEAAFASVVIRPRDLAAELAEQRATLPFAFEETAHLKLVETEEVMGMRLSAVLGRPDPTGADRTDPAAPVVQILPGPFDAPEADPAKRRRAAQQATQGAVGLAELRWTAPEEVAMPGGGRALVHRGTALAEGKPVRLQHWVLWWDDIPRLSSLNVFARAPADEFDALQAEFDAVAASVQRRR